MMFTSDYAEIKRQIRFADEKISTCRSKKDYVKYFENYFMLCGIYKNITGLSILDMNHPKKRRMMDYYNKFRNGVINQFYDEVYDSRDFSFQLFGKVYSATIGSYVDFLNSYDGNLDGSYEDKICEEEALIIIRDFFNKEFPEREELINKYFESGNFFDVSSCHSFKNLEGTVYYNSLENIGNAFFKKSLTSVSGMSTFVHEMGHLFDCADLECIDSKLLLSVCGHYRVDSEFVSYYVQFKFLEYLIENDILKRDAIDDLAINIGSLLFHLENAYFSLGIGFDEFNLLKFGLLQKCELVRLFNENNNNLLPSYMAGGYLDYFVSLDQSICGASGLIMASISSDKDVFDKLMMSRGINDLEKRFFLANVSADTSIKQLVKKIDILYK